MPSPARWSRSLQREWQWQWHEHPGRLRSVLLAWLLLSGSLAGLLWQQRWQLLQQRQNRHMQTDLGLLELRINSHRITALDWGHWDPLYAYAGGEDPGFVQRELSNSSIVEDDQMLLLVDPQFKPLLAKGRGIESGIPERLSRCLQGHLRQLGAPTSSLEDPHRAFGFHCQAGEQSVLGAATAILPSGSRGPLRGWLMHFSGLQRPSYNEAINSAFKRINAGWSEVETMMTERANPSGPRSRSKNSRTSRPRSPIRAITEISLSELRAIEPSRVLLPTPLPAKIPIR